MDFKEGGDGGEGLKEYAAGDVGLAPPKDIGGLHPAVSGPSFLLALPPAAAVPSPFGSVLACLPGNKSLPDRPWGRGKDAKGPVRHLSFVGGLWPFFHLGLFAPGGIRLFTAESTGEQSRKSKGKAQKSNGKNESKTHALGK